MLVVLITILGPISGAHFNPVVSMVFCAEARSFGAGRRVLRRRANRRRHRRRVVAHLMFALPLFEVSSKARTGGAQWFAEGVATFGLVATILAGIRFERKAVPWLVGLYITAAYGSPRRPPSPTRR